MVSIGSLYKVNHPNAEHISHFYDLRMKFFLLACGTDYMPPVIHKISKVANFLSVSIGVTIMRVGLKSR